MMTPTQEYEFRKEMAGRFMLALMPDALKAAQNGNVPDGCETFGDMYECVAAASVEMADALVRAIEKGGAS